MQGPRRVSRGLVIHGGVGTLPETDMTYELEAEYRQTLAESLRAGHAELGRGGSAVDVVVAAVAVMEDSPLFNAGRGSNFDERGVVTMDASIMDGALLAAGAVAGVTDVRSPITLARLVMERSPHVFLIGEGAEEFAQAQGMEIVDPSFFFTQRRWDELQRAKERNSARPNVLGDENSGTVGAVARDGMGRLAAATSTGGMANKTWGRVGDSPIIGAGTYASGRCAVSCTGWGEYFIKNLTAFSVHALMALNGASLADAAREAIFEVLEAQVRRAGGLVAIDAAGNVEMCYSTPGMYRGWIDEDGEPHVAIWEE